MSKTDDVTLFTGPTPNLARQNTSVKAKNFGFSFLGVLNMIEAYHTVGGVSSSFLSEQVHSPFSSEVQGVSPLTRKRIFILFSNSAIRSDCPLKCPSMALITFSVSIKFLLNPSMFLFWFAIASFMISDRWKSSFIAPAKADCSFAKAVTMSFWSFDGVIGALGVVIIPPILLNPFCYEKVSVNDLFQHSPFDCLINSG